ncbi:MAG TPA: pyridoxamine 5'-phosphate oxidase [Pseudomonadales bacterium]|nr:pyridoxamine 5'-phosphate oxidase [Pseudomonadales bacterium]
MGIVLEDLRREYTKGGLDLKDLNKNPLEQFNTWLQQAIDAGLSDPTGMSVATVDADGQPSQRIVLLKHLDERGFVFFTNYGSNKAQDIALNPKVCLHFPWIEIDRQVIVKGVASRVPVSESMSYFLSRPKDSQLAAWASQQSRRLSTRQMLESQFLHMKEKFKHGDVPYPDFWGGYRVVPHSIEFWQGGHSRLHDRFLFTKQDNGWDIERLAP